MPAIENEFGEWDAVPYGTYTVTLEPNGGSGEPYDLVTDTGTVTLPDPASIGFAAPADSVFVGWSTDPAGKTNVYSQDVLFPDNANHTAALNRDTSVFAIWLPAGSAETGVTAYFYIRADGTIPFEPSQGAQSSYAPRGSATTLAGMLRQPVAVTNEPAIVQSNLQTVPGDDQLVSVLADNGITYDPQTEKIIWYVIKSRQYGGGAWNVDGIIVPKDDYMVYYNPNGGFSDVPAAQAYLENTAVAVDFSITPTRPGYEFTGWAESPEAEAPEYPAGLNANFTMPAADKHLYAQWMPRHVNIIYQAQPTAGGAVTETLNRVRSYDGAGVTGSVAVAARGYVFQGWYKGADLIASSTCLDGSDVTRNANRLHGAIAETVFTAHFARASASMTASKAVEGAPANGEYFTEGETVAFSITVANTGNVPLTNVSAADTLAGPETLGTIAPGASARLDYTYTVTAEDARRGYAMNEAAITAEADDGHGNALDVPEQLVGAGVQTGAIPAEETYVLYGAYPADGGTVGQNYALVNADTAEGLTDRTAQPKEGYRFEGWYEGDELISRSATLTAEQMRDALNLSEGTRTAYAPTLFIAHFVRDGDEPAGPTDPNPPAGPTDPDNPSGPAGPDDPDNPTGPDTPGNPEKPDDPSSPGSPAAPDNPASPGNPPAADAAGITPGNAASRNGTDRSAPRTTKAGASASAGRSIPQTGDSSSTAVSAIAVLGAAASLAVLTAARRRTRR